MTDAEQASQEQVEERLKASHEAGDYRLVATLGLRRYGPEVMRFSTAMMKKREEAEDAFAESCEKIWLGIPAFRFECSFRTWAFLICRRVCIQRLRSPHMRRLRPLSEAEPLSAIVQEVRTQTAEYLKEESKDRLKVLRESLSPHEQAILTLRLDRGLGWSEIVEVMNDEGQLVDEQRARREAALRKQFERLKQRLRELAQREGLLNRR